MLKQIVFAVMLIMYGVSIAQNGTTSPYSYFGIGELKFKGTAENRSMGGLNIFSDSIHLNIQNPASAANLRLVNFTSGGSYKYVKQENETASQYASATTLDYLAMGIPMGKFGAIFGILPYTAVGYKLESITDTTNTQYTGTGGMNKVFLAFAYQIIPNFNIGIDANYNFGNIERKSIIAEEGLLLGTRKNEKGDLLGFNFNFGAEYKTMISEDLQLTTSATYSPATKFEVQRVQNITSVLISATGVVIPIDDREERLDDIEVTFPSQLTVGAGIGSPKKWFIGGQYTNSKTSNYDDPTLNFGSVEFIDANKFRIGGFFIPRYTSFTNYWYRVIYRLGVWYEETGINLRGEDINEYGISFGIGLPIGRLFSNVNVGFELGSKGTTKNGLVKENFFNTFISLSLNDKWFEKRYID